MKQMTQKLIDYYTHDFKNPKSSTTAFLKFLEKQKVLTPGSSICDMACGTGSGTYYFAQKHKEIKFLGIDYNTGAIDWGNEMLRSLGSDNFTLEVGDWFNLGTKYSNMFDGIFSVHSFCTLKNIEAPLNALIELNPNWIALNSLFYEGPLDILTHIRDHTNPDLKDDDPDSDFNIFSLPKIKDYFLQQGYQNFHFERFEIDVDLPMPINGGRGTYTIRSEFSPRTQFSGPVYLPWYFLIAKK